MKNYKFAACVFSWFCCGLRRVCWRRCRTSNLHGNIWNSEKQHLFPNRTIWLFMLIPHPLLRTVSPSIQIVDYPEGTFWHFKCPQNEFNHCPIEPKCNPLQIKPNLLRFICHDIKKKLFSSQFSPWFVSDWRECSHDGSVVGLLHLDLTSGSPSLPIKP